MGLETVYKINHKIVALSITCQIVACIFWLIFAPFSLRAQGLHTLGLSTLGVVFSIVVYVYFYAWILNRMVISSKPEMVFTIFIIWLFYLLPNLVIAKELLDLSLETLFYISSFSAVAVVINAFILPFARSSRSIFKT